MKCCYDKIKELEGRLINLMEHLKIQECYYCDRKGHIKIEQYEDMPNVRSCEDCKGTGFLPFPG